MSALFAVVAHPWAGAAWPSHKEGIKFDLGCEPEKGDGGYRRKLEKISHVKA